MKKINIILFIVSSLFSQFNMDYIDLSGAFGSVTIDGEIYNQLSLRPEIPIGKLGLGLDIYFYINGDGELS